MPPMRCAPLLLTLAALAPPAASQEGEAPPSRQLLLELTSQARLAGTSGSVWGARFVARELERAGWRVELDEREVLLSLPRRISVRGDDPAVPGEPLFRREERFDPDAHPPGDAPPFNAWSASGLAIGPVVDAGYGLRDDFERLRGAGVELEGTVALARYGRSYRGVKAQLAEEYGCAAVLLVNDPADSGAGRGEVWPRGPWKPDWSVERGSISPMAKAPGDPSTPGWPSPAPGEEGRRLTPGEWDAVLPGIPCVPLPWREARELLARLVEVHLPGEDGEDERALPLGPGPAVVQVEVNQPRELRTIVNVIATLEGEREELVIAGNHRDAWVRGAHDAGGGTVALLRAAQRLGERARTGWRPAATLKLAFWDAEESGLIGSTEWVEANAELLRERCLVYLNADAAVTGTLFRGAAGTPGVLSTLRAALERVKTADGRSDLWTSWVEVAGPGGPHLGLPGSGSDYTAFLHHLGLPVVDLSLGGNSGGQYHTRFDDFAQVERFLDPGFRGHELAGELVATLLVEFARRGRASFSEQEAAVRLADLARRESGWLGEDRAGRLAAAFEEVAATARTARRAPLYQRAQAPGGLPGRTWFRNRLWAPGLETGYSAESFPTLREAAAVSAAALDAELDSLVEALRRELPPE